MKHSRPRWVIGNWKMHPLTPLTAKELALSLGNSLQPFLQNDSTCIAIAPSVLHFSLVEQHCPLTLCAQDVSSFGMDVGAATGDISAAQLQAMGAKLTLIGHSERRSYLQESNDLLQQKVQQAIHAGLLVVFCVGETKEAYDQGKTLEVLSEQLKVVSGFDCANLMIAYEPVWAIGTGLTPTLPEIEAVHRHIKSLRSEVLVLYGGSVNETNASSFVNSAWIDGVLVGGASLVPEKFAAIAAAFAAL